MNFITNKKSGLSPLSAIFDNKYLQIYLSSSWVSPSLTATQTLKRAGTTRM